MTGTLQRLLRLVLVLAMGYVTASFAQQPPAKGPTPKGPNAPQLKMKSTTNAQRRAAAARNAARKAAAGHRNQVVQRPQGEVIRPHGEVKR